MAAIKLLQACRHLFIDQHPSTTEGAASCHRWQHRLGTTHHGQARAANHMVARKQCRLQPRAELMLPG